MGSVHPKLLLQEAKDLESRGDLKSASIKYALLTQILIRRGKYTEAMELCDKAFSLSPESTRLQLIRAVILAHLKRENEAKAEVEKFAQSAFRQGRVSRYLDLAREQLSLKPRLLKVFLEKVLEVDRTKAEIFFALAQTLQKLGEVERAIEIALSGLKIGEDQATGHRVLKDLLVERGRSEDLAVFNKLIDKSWSLERVCNVLLSEQLPEFEQESEGQSQYLSHVSSSVSGDDGDSIQELIQELEEKLGDRPQGIETITGLVKEFKERAQSLLDGDYSSLIDLALAFREMGLTLEAKEFLSKVSVDSEHYNQAQTILGNIDLDSGSLMGALDIFQNVLRKESLETNILLESLYSTVRIYLELGEVRKAEEYMNRLTQIDSQYRDSNRLRQVIKKKSGNFSK